MNDSWKDLRQVSIKTDKLHLAEVKFNHQLQNG